jgi:hypothetical protein
MATGICNRNLFSLLGGTPDMGGTWTWNGPDGTTIIVDGVSGSYDNGDTVGVNHEPLVDFCSFEGLNFGQLDCLFEYTISGVAGCPDSTACIDVEVFKKACCGLDMVTDQCSNPCAGSIFLDSLLDDDPDCTENDPDYDCRWEIVSAPISLGSGAFNITDDDDTSNDFIDTCHPDIIQGQYVFLKICEDPSGGISECATCEGCQAQATLNLGELEVDILADSCEYCASFCDVCDAGGASTVCEGGEDHAAISIQPCDFQATVEWYDVTTITCNSGRSYQCDGPRSCQDTGFETFELLTFNTNTFNFCLESITFTQGDIGNEAPFVLNTGGGSQFCIGPDYTTTLAQFTTALDNAISTLFGANGEHFLFTDLVAGTLFIRLYTRARHDCPNWIGLSVGSGNIEYSVAPAGDPSNKTLVTNIVPTDWSRNTAGTFPSGVGDCSQPINFDFPCGTTTLFFNINAFDAYDLANVDYNNIPLLGPRTEIRIDPAIERCCCNIELEVQPNCAGTATYSWSVVSGTITIDDPSARIVNLSGSGIGTVQVLIDCDGCSVGYEIDVDLDNCQVSEEDLP